MQNEFSEPKFKRNLKKLAGLAHEVSHTDSTNNTNTQISSSQSNEKRLSIAWKSASTALQGLSEVNTAFSVAQNGILRLAKIGSKVFLVVCVTVFLLDKIAFIQH
jgi:hypothetical protein